MRSVSVPVELRIDAVLLRSSDIVESLERRRQLYIPVSTILVYNAPQPHHRVVSRNPGFCDIQNLL